MLRTFVELTNIICLFLFMASFLACSGDSSDDGGNNSQNPKPCVPGVGDGSSETSPIVICNYDHLKAMAEDTEDDGLGNMILSKHYALGADIDASPSWNEGEADCEAYDGTDIATSNPCAGWEPLPTLTGSLNGRGHSISNLYIYSNANGVGLFSVIGHSPDSGDTNYPGTIKNVHLRKVQVVSTNNGGLVGAFAGIYQPLWIQPNIIDEVSVEGRVKAQGSNSEVGGIVGGYINESFASGADTLILSNSYVNMNIEGAVVGGLIGSGTILTISNSYAKGAVTSVGRRIPLRLVDL